VHVLPRSSPTPGLYYLNVGVGAAVGPRNNGNRRQETGERVISAFDYPSNPDQKSGNFIYLNVKLSTKNRILYIR